MKVRIISALILLPLLAVVYFRGPVLWAAGLIIALVGIYEFFKGFEAMGIRPSHWIGWVSAVSLYGIALFEASLTMYMLWFYAVAAASFLYLFNTEKRQPIDGMATITGAFYIVFFSVHVVLIDKTDFGIMLWLVLIAAFGTDSSAYFTGFLIGKHKLCPSISPKKTVEGAVGGVVGSTLLSLIFGYLVLDGFLLHCLVIGFFGSIAAQIGDLTASVFKRRMGIKDYGKLIPGHGGILDRFDSVLFTAPFVYYYIVLVIF
jgi:phosphatidate cytidylyltransferase